MALKSKVYRLSLQIADLERHHYRDYSLTLARHPSETAERMMLRVLAFAFYADERLEFGRGISTDTEPDLWLRDLDGSVETWIELGTPDPERLKKACARAKAVVLFAYGDRAVPVWLKKHESALKGLKALKIFQVPDRCMQALATALEPGMALQATLSEGEALVSWEQGSLAIAPTLHKSPGDASP